MKRILFALPLAGMMMTAPLAFAQTTTPSPAATAPATPPVAVQPAQPQTDQPQPEAPKPGDCSDKSEDVQTSAAPGDSESATPPVAGPDSGTAPGGAGSSGWTGGLGGSDIGTSQAEELDSSPQQDHPEVATGLDPISGETAVEGPQAPPPPTQPEVAATATC